MHQGVVSLQLFSLDVKCLTCTRLSCAVGSDVQKNLRGSEFKVLCPNTLKVCSFGGCAVTGNQVPSSSKSSACWSWQIGPFLAICNAGYALKGACKKFYMVIKTKGHRGQKDWLMSCISSIHMCNKIVTENKSLRTVDFVPPLPRAAGLPLVREKPFVPALLLFVLFFSASSECATRGSPAQAVVTVTHLTKQTPRLNKCMNFAPTKIGTGTCTAPASCYAACMLSSLTQYSKSTLILTKCFRRNSMSTQTEWAGLGQGSAVKFEV